MTFVGRRKEASISAMAFEETLELLEWPRICDHLSNFASTSQGKRECKTFQLPNDLSTSRLRLAETLEIGDLDQIVEGGISFKGVCFLEKILLRCVKGGIANGEELLMVAETLASARRLRRLIDNAELRPVTTSLLDGMATLPELEKTLKFGLEEGGRVANRASIKLSNLRRQWQALRLERSDCLQGLQKRYASILQDTLLAERNGRPVLAIKSAAVSSVPGIVHDTSSSGSTTFLEPKLIFELGNRIAEVESKIRQEEQFLLIQWSALVGEHFSSLNRLDQVLLQLDLALARARYGAWMQGVPPILKVEEDSPFVFKNLCHPLLMWQERSNNGTTVVPISFEVRSDLKVVAITGPNTGGKTVTIKTVGVAALMARAGLLIPCSEQPTLPWCSQILADIGDEQSLQQNLSTFSSHITRISRILKSIDESSGTSLVLLDEVGAGTDPSEGSALAISLLSLFAERARLTIATTHFGEIKTLKYRDSRFENASVAFDSETMKPTYHLQWGIPGRSNALLIARRLGLDPSVLDKAESLIGSQTGEDLNAVIQGLEEQRHRQQVAAEEAAALLARTELLHEELLISWQKHREQSEMIREHGRKKLELSIRQGQNEVRSLIRRLRQQNANGETARSIGQRLRRIEADHLSKMPKKAPQKNWIPQVGDQIRLLALAKSAEVIEVSEDGLQLTVLCGLFRSKVSLDSVESLDGRKPSNPETTVHIKTTESITYHSNLKTRNNTIDVRGLRVHEAEVIIEEMLRKMNGPLWVIHGIGTGKLKRGIRSWLETLSYVEKVIDAEQNDGGPGCSVIWLR